MGDKESKCSVGTLKQTGLSVLGKFAHRGSLNTSYVFKSD